MMVSKATEVCQVGTNVGLPPRIEAAYWRAGVGGPIVNNAGIGIPLRLAGSYVALTKDIIIIGAVPCVREPICAAMTLP